MITMSEEMTKKALLEEGLTGRIICPLILSFAEKLKIPGKAIGKCSGSYTITIFGRHLGCSG